MERELEPGEPQNYNFYEKTLDELDANGIKTLPQSLHEAILALEADTLFADQLGADFIDEFLMVKRMEWVEYSRHVSDWETNRYMEFY